MTEKSWRDNLRDASFRGVPFHVINNDISVGRRTVVHLYPLKDKPFVEDLGRRDRNITLEAIIIGADYMQGRDALISACEQPGEGTLVHPYYGEMQVTLTESVRVSDSSDQGGMCRISISCVEAGAYTYPAQTANTQSQVLDQAAVTEAAGTEAFTNEFSLEGQPGFVQESASFGLTDAFSQFGAAGTFPFVDAIANADFSSLIGGALGNVQSLLNGPLTLAQTVFNAVSSLRQLAPNARDAFGALVGLFNFGSNHAAIPTTTPTRIVQAGNEAALVELVQVAAVVNAAIAITDIEFANTNEALLIRDNVLDVLETISENTPSDALFDAVQGLRAVVVRDIQARTADLAKQVDFTPGATMPACVLAYRLYGDTGRENEILELNRIQHPGFVPGQRPLKVVANV